MKQMNTSAFVGKWTATVALLVFMTGPVFPLTAQTLQTEPDPPFRGKEIIRTDDFSLTLGSRLQLQYGYLQRDGESDRSSFRIRRGRISMGGSAYDHFDYALQLELAGESVNLIDANVRYRIAPHATLWAGQGKAFFGRQQLTSSGALNFVDRTIVDGRFVPGRQIGVALIGGNESDVYEYNLGVYNGTGINRLNPDDRHMLVARMVLTPLGAYGPVESAFDYPESPRMALGVSGLRTHTGTGNARTEVNRLNLEGAFKLRGWNTTSELYLEEANPDGNGRTTTTGWYLQSGWLFADLSNEIVFRYAVISPNNMPVNQDIIEIGGAVSHYFREHRAKIQADLRNVERKALGTSNLEFRVQFQLAI